MALTVHPVCAFEESSDGVSKKVRKIAAVLPERRLLHQPAGQNDSIDLPVSSTAVKLY